MPSSEVNKRAFAAGYIYFTIRQVWSQVIVSSSSRLPGVAPLVPAANDREGPTEVICY